MPSFLANLEGFENGSQYAIKVGPKIYAIHGGSLETKFLKKVSQ